MSATLIATVVEVSKSDLHLLPQDWNIDDYDDNEFDLPFTTIEDIDIDDLPERVKVYVPAGQALPKELVPPAPNYDNQPSHILTFGELGTPRISTWNHLHHTWDSGWSQPQGRAPWIPVARLVKP